MSSDERRPGAAAAGHALEVERLSVRFGDAVVLDQISFVVPRSTSLSVIGPNGAGKTVLFKALKSWTSSGTFR